MKLAEQTGKQAKQMKHMPELVTGHGSSLPEHESETEERKRPEPRNGEAMMDRISRKKLVSAPSKLSSIFDFLVV